MRDDYQRLLDLREGIGRIEKYTSAGRQEFEKNELVQTWVIHHLQIVCEAARALTTRCKEQQPQVPWEKIAGMLAAARIGREIAPCFALLSGIRDTCRRLTRGKF